MSKKVTIYDISEKLQISPATVSRALNDRPEISKKTRILVKQTASELNYNPNKLAVALKNGVSKNVGVVVPYLSHGLFSSVIRGIEEELSRFNYNIIICQTHDQAGKEKQIVENLLDNQVDGIFISVARDTKDIDHLKEVLRTGKTLVFFDRKKDLKGVGSVIVDDTMGGYLATKHLINRGCQRIAHFHGDLNLEIYRNRYNGYLRALKDSGILINKHLIFPCTGGIEEGAKLAGQLNDSGKLPDAIFSSSDYSALGALLELKNKGVEVPDEIKIIGFSNELFTQFLDIPISSIDQTPLKMGNKAAELFLKSGDRNPGGPENVILKPELIIRQSTGGTAFQQNKKTAV